MSHDPTSSLQSARLAVLLDALDGVAISDPERSSLAWLAGSDHRPGAAWLSVAGELRRATNVSVVFSGHASIAPYARSLVAGAGPLAAGTRSCGGIPTLATQLGCSQS